MKQIRALILSIAVLTLVATMPALAQDQPPPDATAKQNVMLKTKMEDISSWTKQQWFAAKAKWVKEKVKWAHCQAEAIENKLSGRKSWPFLYTCMTTSS